jgi:DNA-binding MarR family transcriptional regulator
VSPTASSTTNQADFTASELGAWRGLLRVHAGLLRALDAELDAAHGIPISSYEVLIHLADAPEGKMRMRDLADAALLSRSGLTRLVDRLERDGLLARESCKSDARGAFAVLTPAGRDMLAAARGTHLAGVRRHFLDHLAADELETLAAIWDRVLPDASSAASAPPCA